MTETITLNISEKNNKTAAIKVENQNVIKEIFPNFNGKEVTTEQLKQLKGIAAYAGQADVLELADISGGKNLLKSKIATGQAFYEKHGFLSGIKNLSFSCLTNDYIYVTVPVGTELGKVKKMFNLPDGSLRNYATTFQHAPGNADLMKTDGNKVWFTAADFARGNNMSLEEVKNYFGIK